MFPRIFLTLFFGFSLLVLSVHAQESVAPPENSDGDEVSFTVADINLGDVVVNEQDGTFSGTFSLFGTLEQNRIVTGILVTDEKGMVVDTVPLEKDISLKQGELQTHPFSYHLPNFLSGKITISVRAETEEGLLLGAQKIAEKDLPEKTNPIQCTVTETATSISCTGERTAEISYYAGSLFSLPVKMETVTFPSDLKPSIPSGRYLVVVKDSETKSVQVFPLRVAGAYGQIQNILLAPGTEQGMIRVTVMTSISPLKNSTLNLVLKDKEGKTCAETTVKNGPIFDVMITTDCVEGTIVLALKGGDGNTLATLTDPFSLVPMKQTAGDVSSTLIPAGKTPTDQKSSHALLVVIFSLLILIIVVAFLFVRKKKKMLPPTASLLFFFFCFAFGLLGMVPRAEALTQSISKMGWSVIDHAHEPAWYCVSVTNFTRNPAAYAVGDSATVTATVTLTPEDFASGVAGTCSTTVVLNASNSNAAFDSQALGGAFTLASVVAYTANRYLPVSNTGSGTNTIPALSLGAHTIERISTFFAGVSCIGGCTGALRNDPLPFTVITTPTVNASLSATATDNLATKTIADGGYFDASFSSSNATTCEVRYSSDGSDFSGISMAKQATTSYPWLNMGPIAYASWPNGIWYKVTCWSVGDYLSASKTVHLIITSSTPTVTVTPYTYQNSSGGGLAFAGEYYGLGGYGFAHISWTSTGGATSCSVRRAGTTVATGLGANSSYNIPSGEAITELSVTYTVTCTNGTNSGSGTATFTRPPDPLSVSISCSADGTVGTVTWTGPSGWNLFYVGKADAAGGGNIGSYGGYTGTSTTFPTTPGHTYFAWVFTEGPGGQWSNAIYTSPYPNSVTCVAPTASFTPVSSPTCYVPYATRGCNLILYWTSANVSSVDLKDCGGGLYGNFGSGNRSWMVYSPGGNPTGGGCYRIHNHVDNAILAQIGTTNICASNLVYDVTALPPDGDPYLGRCVCSPGSSWDNGSSSCVASTASFTATPGCTIGPGASSCNTVLGWTSANIANVKLTDCSGTTSYGTFGSGSQSGTVSVPYNSGCYQIRKQSDNSIISTANAVIPSSCGGGSVWNGTRCNLASGLLTVSLAGTGSGSISSAPAGVSCGVDCTENYPLGTDVILTATPVLGSVFTGWSGDCSGNGTCTLTMNMAHVVTATFTVNPAELYPVNLSRSGNLTQGNVLTFNVSVTNQGFSAAPSSNVRFCMDNASCSTSTTGQLGADAGTGAIPVGALSGSISQTWTATTQGNHTLYVCADAGNLVHEQNEGNNCIRLNFSVSPAPPSLTCS